MLVKASGQTSKSGDCQRAENPHAKDRDKVEKSDLDRALDHALEQTFPASDPLSTVPGPGDDEEELPAA